MISEFRTHKITSLKLVLFLFIAALTVTFFMGKAHADEVFYVTPTGGTYNSIQDAINASSIGLDKVTIKVAEGRYQQSLNIGQAKDLTIQGGWNSTFTNRDTKRPTIINGSAFGASISINPGSTVVMEGLTVTHGNSSGLQINNSTVTVRKSKIGRNHNAYRGGGIYSFQSTLIVEDTVVSENSVISGSLNTDAAVDHGTLANGGGYGGGGIYASDTYLTMRNSTIRDNYDNAGFNFFPSPNSGGGIHLNNSEATIENSKILNNLAMVYAGDSNGGGIYSAGSDLSITNTIVAGNYASYSGGGLYFNNVRPQTQIDPPTLAGELNGVQGSTPNDLTIVNSTFANNAADYDSFKIALTGLGGDNETNSGLLNGFNKGGGGARIYTGSGTSTVSILNSVFWGNRDSSVSAPYSQTNDLDITRGTSTTIDVSYSDIGVATGDPFAGAGNISTNPLFVDSNDNHLYDASTANYHLRKFSPAIDSGTGAGAPAADIDGVTRPKGGGVDMGVYEEPFNYDTKAPKLTINTPKYSITRSKNHKIRVRWRVTDPALSSGGLKARIWVRRGGSKTWTLWQDWTTSRSRVYNGRRRKTYFFKGEAKDAAGNVSKTTREWSTVVPADTFLTDFGITTSSGMRFFKGSNRFKRNYYQSTVRSTKKGSFVTYRFKAKQFTLWATKGPRNGKAKVYVNGSFSRLINTNRATSKHRVMVYKKNFAKIKYHTIKIVNVGNPGKNRIDLDALGVFLP